MPSSLAQKLQIKSGKLIVMNAPQGYAGQLAQELKDLTVSTRAAGQAEAVLLFVNSLAEVDTHGAQSRPAGQTGGHVVDRLRQGRVESEDRCEPRSTVDGGHGRSVGSPSGKSRWTRCGRLCASSPG